MVSPLRTHSGGLIIIRRFKHEWNPALEGLPVDRLARMTDKVYGSKFLRSWSLNRLVDWIEEQVERREWPPGTGQKLDVRLPEPVGLVAGGLVHTIR